MRERFWAGWVLLTSWGPFILVTVFYGGLALPCSLLGFKTIAKNCIYWWSKASCRILDLNPKVVSVEGATWGQDFKALKQGVMIANHASHLDIILICSLAAFDMRILAKSSLFKIPFFH